MKVLVTGVNGQLGYDVCNELTSRGIENKGIDKAECDITNKEQVFQYFRNYKPDAVIHCAAYTAVDNAEDNVDLCRQINLEGTQYIAEVCKELDAKLMYISTDYVFNGKGYNFFNVDDEKGPLNIYGLTKLEGEKAVKDILTKYFIVRISWVFGLNGNNFINTMIKLGENRKELNIVSDQIGSPTYTYDLAPLLCDMIVSEKYGEFHATNEGVCSWAEFAECIFKEANLNVKVNYIKTEDYPTKAVRPKNSRMSKDSLLKAGFSTLPTWQDAVKRYVKAYLEKIK